MDSGLGSAVRTAGRSPAWPSDGVLLPVRGGALLVSREHARFCRVPAAQVGLVEEALRGAASWEACDAALVGELARHGFGRGPSQAEAKQPSVLIQLTNGCNLGCSYCCTNSRREAPGGLLPTDGLVRRKELTHEAALAAVRATREVFGTNARVNLIGGEPLLVPWALDLAEQILELGLDLHISSNGVPAANPAVAQRLAALVRRGAVVRMSLAGVTRERCDAESGGKRFDATVAAVHAMARAGGLPVLDLMLFPEDVALVARELPALRRALPEGVEIALGFVYPSGREEGARVFGSRSTVEAALDRIALEAGEAIPGPSPSPTAPRRDGCDCTQGHGLHIRSDGELHTCFRMEEPVGRLDDEPFAASLRRRRAHPVLAQSYPTCAPCPLATLCGGGCRAENVRHTGDGGAPPCGPWRVRVLCELLAEDRPDAMSWPVEHLLAEAHARDIPAPERLTPLRPSHALVDIP